MGIITEFVDCPICGEPVPTVIVIHIDHWRMYDTSIKDVILEYLFAKKLEELTGYPVGKFLIRAWKEFMANPKKFIGVQSVDVGWS